MIVPNIILTQHQIGPFQAYFPKISEKIVGLPGFEPGSRAPEAHSLDQASRQPLMLNASFQMIEISVPQHL